MRASAPRSSFIQKHDPFPAGRIGGSKNRILNPLIVHGPRLLARVNEKPMGRVPKLKLNRLPTANNGQSSRAIKANDPKVDDLVWPPQSGMEAVWTTCT